MTEPAGDSRGAMALIGRISRPGQVLLLAAVYFVTAKASLLLAIPPGYATAVWPPSGIALAALLLLGNRVWPGIWLGATLVNLTVASSPATALIIGTGNTLEALASTMLIRRFIGIPRRFERPVRLGAPAPEGIREVANISLLVHRFPGIVRALVK